MYLSTQLHREDNSHMRLYEIITCVLSGRGKKGQWKGVVFIKTFSCQILRLGRIGSPYIQAILSRGVFNYLELSIVRELKS